MENRCKSIYNKAYRVGTNGFTDKFLIACLKLQNIELVMMSNEDGVFRCTYQLNDKFSKAIKAFYNVSTEINLFLYSRYLEEVEQEIAEAK